MFQEPQDKKGRRFDPLIEFERHQLQMAIEVARAQGFTGTESAFTALLHALEESQEFPDF